MVALRSIRASSSSSPSVPLSKRGLSFNISTSIRIGHEVTLCNRRSPRIKCNNDNQWRYLKCIFTCPSLSSPTPVGICSSSSSSPSSACHWQQQQRQQLHLVLQRVSLHASKQFRRYTTVLSILLWLAIDTTSFVKDKRQLCSPFLSFFDKVRVCVRVCFASFSM